MNVYKIASADGHALSGGVEFISLKPKRTDFKHFRELKPGLPIASWKPLVLSMYNPKGRPCDVMWCGLDLIVSDRVLNSACRPALERGGQLLPVKVAGCKRDYAIFQCTNVLEEVLLHEKSVYVWQNSDIRRMAAPVFRPEGLQGVGLFKFPKYGLTLPFCTEDDNGVGFKKTFCDLGLVGIDFTLVWSLGKAPIIPDQYLGTGDDLRTGAGDSINC